MKLIKLKDLLIEQPPKPGSQPPPKKDSDSEETEKKLKIDIPNTPFSPDAGQILSKLKHTLKRWSNVKYPNDRVRWQEYYKDIFKMVKQIEGDKGEI